MAQFVNESTAMKFALTVDDAKKTVSVSKIASTATADKLNKVAQKFNLLFVTTPTAVKRNTVDLIEAE